MLPLRRAAEIVGHGRPIVVPGVVFVLSGKRNHGLDREGHAGLHHKAGVAIEVVGNVWLHVEHFADSMADEGPHNAEPEFLGVRLDCRADHVDGQPGLYGGDAEVEAFLGDLHQLHRRFGHIAHTDHDRVVAVHAVEEDGDVEVDDVAVLERAIVRDAVTNDFVDRGTDRFGKSAVSDAAGIAAKVDIGLMGDRIEFVGSNAYGNVGLDDLGHLCGRLACRSHSLNRVRILDERHVGVFRASAVGDVIGPLNMGGNRSNG